MKFAYGFGPSPTLADCVCNMMLWSYQSYKQLCEQFLDLYCYHSVEF